MGMHMHSIAPISQRGLYGLSKSQLAAHVQPAGREVSLLVLLAMAGCILPGVRQLSMASATQDQCVHWTQPRVRSCGSTLRLGLSLERWCTTTALLSRPEEHY